MRDAGLDVSLFSFEDFQTGSFRANPQLTPNAEVLYRGWMMSGEDYRTFAEAILKRGSKPFTDHQAYLASHHLPNWYPKLKDLTPETRIFAPDCDLAAELQNLDWPEFFIKDYVKSLKTSVGSRISKAEQASAVVAEMKHYRGQIEGGFCVRRVEEFLPQTETRYFVLNGIAHAPTGEAPSIVSECAKRLSSRFYSIDVVQCADGQSRIVEVGDGQVSDLVGWRPTVFANVLAKHFLKL